MRPVPGSTRVPVGAIVTVQPHTRPDQTTCHCGCERTAGPALITNTWPELATDMFPGGLVYVRAASRVGPQPIDLAYGADELHTTPQQAPRQHPSPDNKATPQ